MGTVATIGTTYHRRLLDGAGTPVGGETAVAGKSPEQVAEIAKQVLAEGHVGFCIIERRGARGPDGFVTARSKSQSYWVGTQVDLATFDTSRFSADEQTGFVRLVAEGARLARTTDRIVHRIGATDVILAPPK